MTYQKTKQRSRSPRLVLHQYRNCNGQLVENLFHLDNKQFYYYDVEGGLVMLGDADNEGLCEMNWLRMRDKNKLPVWGRVIIRDIW